jgi:hypothetical protein
MDIDTIGVALIVGGLAFLCSGLIFLLPTGRTSQEASIEEDREKVDSGLRASRRERGEL